MTNISFYPPACPMDEGLRFAVIAARYRDKWVFCRHKLRATWEIPGGHREPGEAIDETARRELWEETGACDADIRRVAVYSVEKESGLSRGMLYFARIARLDDLPPESEIGEICLSDTLPPLLTYPDIQPHLFHNVQSFLNLQSSAGELWDVYDENRRLTGRLHRRGDFMPAGDYHLVVHIWLQNSRGEFLLTKRSPNKGYPLMWESTGGSALAGDDSLRAAMREVREETGLTVDPACGECVMQLKLNSVFVDVWLFRQDFDLRDVVLQEGETCDKMYATAAEIKKMRDDGLFVPQSYLDELLDGIQ